MVNNTITIDKLLEALEPYDTDLFVTGYSGSGVMRRISWGNIRRKIVEDIDLKISTLSQIAPEFVESTSEMKDQSKIYLMPDGYLYAYMKAKIYRNWLLEAEDDSGNYYNGGQGYKDKYRLNSSGTEAYDNADIATTGFIPFKIGDVLRFKNVNISSTDSGYNQYFAVYDSNKNKLRSGYASNYNKALPDDFEMDASGNWALFDTRNIEELNKDIDWSDTSYFRISAPGFSSNTIITINEKIEGVQEDVGGGGNIAKAWMNTGLQFIPADYENRIIELEHAKTILSDRITEIEKQLDGSQNVSSDDNSLPSYWITHLEERCDDIRQAMENAGRNKSSFFWYHDAHWNYNSGKSPLLLKYMYKNTPINKTNFGGDIVNNEPTNLTDRETMKYLWQWRKMIRDLPNHHSAIGNHDDGNTTDKIFPANYIYAYLLAPEENNDVILGDGFYYYIDNKSEKTRYLYLDTAYEIYKDVSSTQLAFVNEALKSTPDNWHIVAIAHLWHNTNYTTSPPTVSDISIGASKLLALFDDYNARNGSFSTCKGRVEFCIGGHCHIDHDSRSDGGIPVILTETDSGQVRSGLTYTVGTITESSVNAIIASYEENKIYIIRVGRGESREVILRT